MKRAALAGAVILAAAPASVLLTFLLTPFWRWLEEVSGIESIGHSGPAVWCYAVLFGACLLICGAVAWMVRPTKEQR